MLHSTRLNLAYPDPTNELESADVPRDIATLVGALDLAQLIYSGPIGSLPTSSPGSPGIIGRWYWASDVTTLSFDYGTGWVQIYPQTQTLDQLGGVDLPLLVALGG